MTLTKTGAGTLTLSTANTFTGAVADNAGTLELAPPGTVTMNNVFTGSGALAKSGVSLLVIGGNEKQNTSFSGPVTVNGGTLQFGTSQWNKYRGLYHATSYTINSGAVLSLFGQANMGNYPITINGGTLQMYAGYNQLASFTLNGGTVDARQGLNSSYNTFAMVGTITVTGTEPSRILSTGSSDNSIHMAYKTYNLSRTFNVADVTGDTNADLIVSARLIRSVEAPTDCSLVKTGEGTMTLSAVNAYGGTTGTTTVNAGTLLVSGSLDSPTVNVNDGGTLLVSSSSPLPKSIVTIAAGGTFGAAGTVATSVTNLIFAEDSNISWSYDGDAQTAGLVTVTGTLTLPAAATVKLSGSGALRSDQVLFTAGTIAGSTDLSGWTVNNIPEGTFAGVQLIDNQVILKTFRGTVITIR
jgi:autotransporter-associated beta strand protein